MCFVALDVSFSVIGMPDFPISPMTRQRVSPRQTDRKLPFVFFGLSSTPQSLMIDEPPSGFSTLPWCGQMEGIVTLSMALVTST